jgi:anaerobic selenocysteine-containing dehydrogenase
LSRVSLENIIIAIPSYNLRLTVMEMLVHANEKFKTVENFTSLAQSIQESEDSILVIDILAYSVSERRILAEICEEISLPVILLLYGNELLTEDYLECSKICCVVEKEVMDSTFLLALKKARQEYEQKSAAENLLDTKKQLPPLNQREVNLMGKEDGNIFGKSFGRRSFLKGSTAAAAVAGVAVASPGNTVMKALAAGDSTQTAIPEEKVFAGACRGNCAGNCQMNVHVRDGKVVKTSKRDYPDPYYNRICSRGLSHVQRIYGPERIKYPMRRVGERGAGQWEQLTWDEAIAYICTKWKSYREKFGNTSIAYNQSGGNSGKDTDYVLRLFNYLGASNVHYSFDQALLYTAPISVGYGAFMHGNDVKDMMNSKYIFVWGSNPTEARHVQYWSLLNAVENGAKMIVIDPNVTIAAKKADKFVPIRPCTDAVLAFAMINIVVKEGKADKDFLAKATVAPFLVKESDGKYLRQSDLGQAPKAPAATAAGQAAAPVDGIVVRSADGKVGLPSEIPNPVINGTFEINGIKVTTAYDLLLKRIAEWTPERASELCDIPVDTIYELAHMYVEGPTTLYAAYGPDHYGNGHTAYYAFYALAMVTGQLSKPGAGLGGGFTANLGAGSDNKAIISPPPGVVPGPTIFGTKLLDVLNEGKYRDIPLNLKSLYIYKSNMVGTHTERKSVIEAFNKLDLVVVSDQIMSDTARYADIVLPVAHYFEVETCNTGGTPFAVLNEKAIEPAFESKGDFEIANLLGKGMGLGEHFNMTREEYHTKIFENPISKAIGLSWERLKKERAVRTMPEAPYIHGAGGKFTTATGRAQFYQENPKPAFNYGQPFDPKKECLPYWEPPLEAWQQTVGNYPAKSLASKYPLIFTSERAKFKAHTQFTHCQWLLEILPEPTIEINPQDAAARGIRQGDPVKVYNDRGYVVLKANLHAGLRPGVLCMDHGWQEGQFIEGHYSDLSSRADHPAVSNNCYFDCLVEVKKV